MSKEVNTTSEQALVPIGQQYGTIIQREEDVDPDDIVLLASVRIQRRAQESYNAEQARSNALNEEKSTKPQSGFKAATAEFIRDPKTFAEFAVQYICQHRDEIKRAVDIHFRGMSMNPTMDEIIQFIVDKEIFPKIAPSIILSTNGKILATDRSTLSELGTFIHGPMAKFLEQLMGHYCQKTDHKYDYKPKGSSKNMHGDPQYDDHEINRRARNSSESDQLQIFIDYIFKEQPYTAHNGSVLAAQFLDEYPARQKPIAISEFLEKLQTHLRKILHEFSDPSETYATGGSQIYSQLAAGYSGGAETRVKRSPLKDLDALLDIMVCRLMHLESPEIFHKTAGGDISKKRADFEKQVDEFIHSPESTVQTMLVRILMWNREQIIADLNKLQEDSRFQNITPDQAAKFIMNHTIYELIPDIPIMKTSEDLELLKEFIYRLLPLYFEKVAQANMSELEDWDEGGMGGKKAGAQIHQMLQMHSPRDTFWPEASGVLLTRNRPESERGGPARMSVTKEGWGRNAHGMYLCDRFSEAMEKTQPQTVSFKEILIHIRTFLHAHLRRPDPPYTDVDSVIDDFAFSIYQRSAGIRVNPCCGVAGLVEDFNPLEDPNRMIDLMICGLMKIRPECVYQTKPVRSATSILAPDQREENNICLADIERYDRFLGALRIQMKLIAIRKQIRRSDLGLTEDGKTDSSEPEIEHRFFRDMAIHSVGTEILDFIDQLPSKEDLSRLDNLPRIWYPLCGISRQELKRLKKLKAGMMTTLEELESNEVPNILGLYKVMMAAYKYYEVGKRLFQKYEGQERMAGEMYMEIGRIIAERAKMAARTTDSAIEIDKANLEDEGDNLIGLLHVPDEKELQRSLMGHMVSLNAMFNGIARVRRESAALNAKLAGELPSEK